MESHLLKNLIHNVHHKDETGSVFEIGRIFGKAEGEYQEQNRLALMSWGESAAQLWSYSPAPQVFQMKSAIELLLKQLG